MSAWIAGAIMGGSYLVGSYINSQAAEDAADTQAEAATAAGAAQVAAAQLGVDESRRQFDAMQALLDPYVKSGTQSLSAQKDLAGLNGPEAQRLAMEGVSGSPEMAALTAQGENAMLQQGAATGGLRGGNIQGALAQFRPQMLSSLINQQYGRLSGITQMGQASAAGVGAAGMQTGAQIAGLYGQQGDATANALIGAGQANAGGQLAQGQAWAQPLNQFGQLAGLYGLGKLGIF